MHAIEHLRAGVLLDTGAPPRAQLLDIVRAADRASVPVEIGWHHMIDAANRPLDWLGSLNHGPLRSHVAETWTPRAPGDVSASVWFGGAPLART